MMPENKDELLKKQNEEIQKLSIKTVIHVLSFEKHGKAKRTRLFYP